VARFIIDNVQDITMPELLRFLIYLISNNDQCSHSNTNSDLYNNYKFILDQKDGGGKEGVSMALRLRI